MLTASSSLDALHCAEQLSMARNLSDLAAKVKKFACDLTGATQARLYRYELASSCIWDVDASPTSTGPHHRIDETIPGQCALSWEPQLCQVDPGDASQLPGFSPFEGNVLSIPIFQRGALRGILSVGGQAFDASHTEQLQMLGRVVALVEPTAAQRQDVVSLEKLLEMAVVPAVEGLPDTPSGHVTRIASLVTELGTLLDLSGRTRQQLWRAAHFHDVGKLRLRECTQWELDQRHAQVGAELLADCRPLAELAPLVASHHERFDGSGFPTGKKGDELPLESWILALADHVEDFCSEHPDDSLHDKVQLFLEQGQHLHHPLVLDALCGLLDQGRLEAILA